VGVYRALKTIDLQRVSSENVSCRELTALTAYCRPVGRHPNLIEVFHVGVQDNLLYYTMELADNDVSRKPVYADFPEVYRPLTLQQVIRQGPVRVDTAMEVALRLLRGLARLHDVDLAHRDIKPANIVFVRGQPKLADIGMVTATGPTASHIGTPAYMPPDRQMDPTADTYAIGKILYELLTGRRPEAIEPLPDEILYASGQWDIRRVGDVLLAACAPDAEQRYGHAQRLLEELESARELPADALFADLQAAEAAGAEHRRSSLTPIIVATINALPWILGLLLVFLLVRRFV
jgi:serine/threonine protein kinase